MGLLAVAVGPVPGLVPSEVRSSNPADPSAIKSVHPTVGKQRSSQGKGSRLVLWLFLADSRQAEREVGIVAIGVSPFISAASAGSSPIIHPHSTCHSIPSHPSIHQPSRHPLKPLFLTLAGLPSHFLHLYSHARCTALHRIAPHLHRPALPGRSADGADKISPANSFRCLSRCAISNMPQIRGGSDRKDGGLRQTQPDNRMVGDVD